MKGRKEGRKGGREKGIVTNKIGQTQKNSTPPSGALELLLCLRLRVQIMRNLCRLTSGLPRGPGQPGSRGELRVNLGLWYNDLLRSLHQIYVLPLSQPGPENALYLIK